jgi:formate hydrogenlyase subunit 3/multisubunit Na+/H+ antiporter MnhD subunit
MPKRRCNLGTIAMVGALIVILAAALWFAASAWTALSGPPMPPIGYVAMTLGIVFSLIVGCGLMALVFYSSRYGYDDQHPAEHDNAQQ